MRPRTTLRGESWRIFLVALTMSGSAISVSVMIAQPAHAQSVSAEATVLGGIETTPSYFGSDENEIGPAFDLRIDYLRLPGGLEFGSTRAVGFLEGFGPRFAARYIGSRKASDQSELRGLDNVDQTLELGGGFGYDARDFRVFADVMYGVVGTNAWTGQVGADAIYYPTDALILTAGPRLEWGSARFNDTYFGVSTEEANRSEFSKFDAGSGLVSVGIELSARYSFSENWGVEGIAAYDRLVEDAADSPITELGSADQFGVRIGVTRSISLDF